MHDTDQFKKDIQEYYDIEEELGSGQFAVVRKIVEKETGDEYAAKYVRKKRSKASRNGMSREDIKREIEILRLVDHEKIIKVHEVYETDREMVLIMELLRGGELFDYISKKDFLTEEEAIDFTRQILQGLQHLHSKNVVHLDLKPENILLKNTRKKVIKLVDFGLARVVKENEQVREIMGTPEFVAPEVLNFDTISTATDMWALGVIAYILLSGASPFLGEDNQETFTNIIQVDYQFDEEYFEEISDEAKDFIKKLLVKDPRKRPTAHECSRHTWVEEVVADKKKRQRRRTTQICTFNFKRFVARKRWKMSYNKIRAMNMIAKMGLKPPPGCIIEIPPMPEVIDVKALSDEVASSTKEHKEHKKHSSSINRRKHKQHSAPKASEETSDSLKLKSMEIDIGDSDAASSGTELEHVPSDHDEPHPSPSEPKDYAAMSMREKRRARGQLRHDEIVKSKEEITAKEAKPEVSSNQAASQDDTGAPMQQQESKEVEEVGSVSMEIEHKPVAKAPSGGILKKLDTASPRVSSAGDQTKLPHGILKHSQRHNEPEEDSMEVGTEDVEPGTDSQPMDVVVQPVEVGDKSTGVEDIPVNVEEKPVELGEHAEHKGKLMTLEDKLAGKPAVVENIGKDEEKPGTIVDKKEKSVEKPGNVMDKPGTIVDKKEKSVEKPGKVAGKLGKFGEKHGKVANKQGKFVDKFEKLADKQGKIGDKAAKFGDKQGKQGDKPVKHEEKPAVESSEIAIDASNEITVNVERVVPALNTQVKVPPPEVITPVKQPVTSEVKVETTEIVFETNPTKRVQQFTVDTKPVESKETTAQSTGAQHTGGVKPALKNSEKPAQRLQPTSWQKQTKTNNDKQKPLHGVSKVSLKANRFMNNNNKSSSKSPTSPVGSGFKASNVFGKSKAFQKEDTAESSTAGEKKSAPAKSNPQAELKSVACEIDLDEAGESKETQVMESKVAESKPTTDHIKKVEEKPKGRSGSFQKNIQTRKVSSGAAAYSKALNATTKVKPGNVVSVKTIPKSQPKEQSKALVNGVNSKPAPKVAQVSGKEPATGEKSSEDEELRSASGNSLTEFTIRPRDNSMDSRGSGYDITLTIGPQDGTRRMSLTKAKLTSSSSSSLEGSVTNDSILASASAIDVTSHTRDRINTPPAQPPSSTQATKVANGKLMTSQSAVDMTRDNNQSAKYTPQRDFSLYLNETGKKPHEKAPPAQEKAPIVVKAQSRSQQGITVKRANSPVSVAPGKKPTASTTVYVPRRTFGFQAKLVDSQSQLVLKPAAGADDAPKLNNNNDQTKRWSQSSNASDRSASSGSSEDAPIYRNKLAGDSQGELVNSTERLVNEQNSANISQKIENCSSPATSPRASPTTERKWKATLVVPKEYEKNPKRADVRQTSTQKHKFSNMRSKWEGK